MHPFWIAHVLQDTRPALKLQQSPVMDQLRKDEEVLRELGYKQVLYRTWGTFTTVTIAISAMSVLTSVSGELTHGYPVGPNAPVTLA